MDSLDHTDSGARRDAIGVVASEKDRERAFGRARRHTWTVRFLKLALPLVALGCTAIYGATLWTTSALRGAKIAVENVRIDPTNLTMENPKYEGFAKDGGRYRVRAANAVTDLKMTGPVRLNVIDGELTQPSGVVTRLKAKWGTYDQKADILELYERIDVAGTDGMKAKLTRATVRTKDNSIVTNEPVWAETATGEIRARSMQYDGKSRRAAFRNDVQVTLKPSAGAQAGAAAPKKATPMPALQASSGEPVLITSARLDVDDTQHIALFRETVVARQGEAELQAPELDVIYEGRATDTGAANDATPKAATAPGATDTRLKTIHARGGVVMTSRGDRADSQTLDYDATTERVTLTGDVVMTQQPDRRMTAAKAILDQKADTALMTGGVVVNQARNILRSQRLAIDRKSGTARLSSPAEDGKPAGRIYTLFYQATADKAPVAKAAVAEPAADNQSPFGAGFKTDPNAPIEVEAATLDVLDRKHQAVYGGQVVAKQGDFVVRSEELTAHYTGETGLVADPQAAKVADAAKAKAKGQGQGPGNAELKRIEARRNVVVTGKDGQKATGEWADFDVKSNTVVLGGKVQVATGKNVVRLPETQRFVMDLTNGITRTVDEPGAAGAGDSGAKVSGAFSTSVTSEAAGKGPDAPICPKGAVCRTGRLEVIFYPKDIDKSKIGVGKAGAASATKGGAGTEAAPPAIGQPAPVATPPAAVAEPVDAAALAEKRRRERSKAPEASSWSPSATD